MVYIFDLFWFVFPLSYNRFIPQVKQTAENVNEAVKELPDANLVSYPGYLFIFFF